MANPGQSLGGLLGGVDTSQLPGDTTSQSNQSSAVSQAPASLFAPASTAAAVSDLSGGSSNFDPSTIFDPTLFGGQGVFSPTQTDTGNLPPSTPAIAQAQQDPSGQIIDQQQPVQQPQQQAASGRSNQGDTSQPQTDQTSGQSDQTTPQGQQQQRGQQQQPQQPSQQGQPPANVDPRAPLQPPQSPLQRLLASQRPAASTPAAPTPAPAAPAQPPSFGGGGRGASSPAPAPPSPGGGPPPLLRAIMSLLGIPTPGGPQSALQQVAGQAYPQRPGLPMTPAGGLGPYGRAFAARRRAFGGGDQGRDDVNYSGTSRVPPPGSTAEVSAPTSDQVRASRMAGTDTPPTEGFSNYLQSERAHFGTELQDPKTKWETLAMIGLEHGEDPAAVAESLLNRANYAKTSISNMLHSGFYGPINHGQLAREIRMLQRNPEYAAKLNAGLETAMRGSNLLGGATDQGSGNDPNVGHAGGRVIRYRETYNDWGGGPGGHDGAAAYRRAQQQRVRQEQAAGKRGEQLAMDIGRVRSALPVGGAEVGPMRMPRGGTSGKEFRSIEEQRRKRIEEANALT